MPEKYFIFLKKQPRPNLKVLLPNLDICEKIEKVDIKKGNFYLFFAAQLSWFLVRIVLKADELAKDSNLKEPGVSYKQKIDFRNNHGKNIWDKL